MRECWVDWTKAISIFFVVMGHCWMIPNNVGDFIFLFQVPLFFVASGYLYKKKNILYYIKRLILPILLLSLINALYYSFYRGISFFDFIRNNVIIGYSDKSGTGLFTGMWFIQSLILCRLIAGDICETTTKYYKGVALGILVVFSIFTLLVKDHSYLYIEYVLPSFPLFAFGMFIKEYNFDVKLRYVPLLLALFCVTAVINKSSGIQGGHFGLCYALFFIKAISIILIIIKLCKYLPKVNFVEIISLGTLFILGTHTPMINDGWVLFPGKLYNLLWIILPIIIIVIDYVFIKVIYKYCPFVIGISRKQDKKNK